MELQEFGKELRQMRKEMGMTQEQLAEELNVTPQEISRYEKGHREMGAMMFAKLQKLHEKVVKKKNEELFEKIRKLKPEQQEAVKYMISAMAM